MFMNDEGLVFILVLDGGGWAGKKKHTHTHTGIIRSKCVRLGGAICLWLDNYVIYSARGYRCSHVASELGCPICISTWCYCLLLDAGKFFLKKTHLSQHEFSFQLFCIEFLETLFIHTRSTFIYLFSITTSILKFSIINKSDFIAWILLFLNSKFHLIIYIYIGFRIKGFGVFGWVYSITI